MSDQLPKQIIRISTLLVLSIFVVFGTAAARKNDEKPPVLMAANDSHQEITTKSTAIECLVPSDSYDTVQAALDDAACTTISLAENLFQENLIIARSVAIEGRGADKSIIDGRRLTTAIHIDEEAIVILSNLAITRGRNGFGGGIFNNGNVTLDGVLINNNAATGDGGGMINKGVAALYNSTIIANKAVEFSGGGLRNEGQMYINNSTIAMNTANFSGGGVSNEDDGEVWIYSSTITANRGGIGGGLAGNEHGNGKITIMNTLVSRNRPTDCARRIVSNGYNLVEAPESCALESKATDILRLPAHLGEREGLPDYYPLTSLSPAVDKGDPAGCVDHQGNLLVSDQRGVARDDYCDIGSVEFDGELNRFYFPAQMHTGCPNFFDDYSDARSGWTISDNDHVQTGYTSSEYQIFVKDPSFYYLYLSPACPRAYYTLEVDARWQGTPGATYGLAFGASADLRAFYIFEMNAEKQLFRILYINDRNVSEVAPVLSSPAIKNDGDWNKLELRWQNNLVVAAVNGLVLGTWPVTNSASPTYAGVFATSYANQAQSDARFDNFSVETEDGNSAADGLMKTTPTASQEAVFMRLVPLYTALAD